MQAVRAATSSVPATMQAATSSAPVTMQAARVVTSHVHATTQAAKAAISHVHVTTQAAKAATSVPVRAAISRARAVMLLREVPVAAVTVHVQPVTIPMPSTA